MTMNQILITVFLIQQLLSRPLFVLHGFGETCADIKQLMDPHDSSYSCITNNEGTRSTGQLSRQAISVCESLKKIKDISKGFNVIAFGHGGLIARTILAECPVGQYMKRLVTFSTPNLGLSDYPSSADFGQFDKQKIFDKVKELDAAANSVRALYAPFAYRYTSVDENGKSSSSFLNRINLGNPITLVRYNNLELMVNFAMNNDPTVIPEDSATFGVTFRNGRITRFFPETEVYKRNQLGLKDMYEENRLINCSIIRKNRLKYALFMAQNILRAGLKSVRENGKIDEKALKNNGKMLKMLVVGAPNKIKCEGKMIQYSNAIRII